MMKVRTQSVSQWEAGRRTPDVNNILRMCLLLDVTPNDILKGAEIDGVPTAEEIKQRAKLFGLFTAEE